MPARSSSTAASASGQIAYHGVSQESDRQKSPAQSAKRAAIFVSRADGSNRVLIARGGWGPDWSPDGTTIAYRGDDGIRLVTGSSNGGLEVTPNGKPIAPKGLPAWSPDGKTIAIGTLRGVFLVDKYGAHRRRATALGRGVIGTVRPAWYPSEALRGERPTAKECGSCLTRRALLLVALLAALAVAASAHATAPGTNGRIAFERLRFQNSPPWGELFTTNPGRQRPAKVTHPPNGTQDSSPDWSPDGSSIAFERVPRTGAHSMWTVPPTAAGCGGSRPHARPARNSEVRRRRRHAGLVA